MPLIYKWFFILEKASCSLKHFSIVKMFWESPRINENLWEILACTSLSSHFLNSDLTMLLCLSSHYRITKFSLWYHSYFHTLSNWSCYSLLVHAANMLLDIWVKTYWLKNSTLFISIDFTLYILPLLHTVTFKLLHDIEQKRKLTFF